MDKKDVCDKAAKDWLAANPGAKPSFSRNGSMLFNDNEDADDIEIAITEAGHAAGYFIEPIDVVAAALTALKGTDQ